MKPRYLSFLCLVLPALALVAACGGSGSGGGGGRHSTTGLGEPTPGLVHGNWSLDGSTVTIIRDTGPEHDVTDGMIFRLGEHRAEVLLGLAVEPGNLNEELVRIFGATYEERSSISETSFRYRLVMDFSEPNEEPRRTTYIAFTVEGEVVGDELQVYYLFQEFGLSTQGHAELDRDELEFVCRPEPATDPNVDGIWSVSKIDMLADEGSTFFWDEVLLGDKLVIDGANVVSIPPELFWASSTIWQDLDIPDTAIMLSWIEEVELGRVQGMVVFFDDFEDFFLMILYDFVRLGDEMAGELLFDYEEKGEFDVYDLWLTMRRGPPKLGAGGGSLASTREMGKLSSFVQRQVATLKAH